MGHQRVSHPTRVHVKNASNTVHNFQDECSLHLFEEFEIQRKKKTNAIQILTKLFFNFTSSYLRKSSSTRKPSECSTRYKRTLDACRPVPFEFCHSAADWTKLFPRTIQPLPRSKHKGVGFTVLQNMDYISTSANKLK